MGYRSKKIFPHKEIPLHTQSYHSTAVVLLVHHARKGEMRNSHRTSLQGIVQLDHCHSAFSHQIQGLVEYRTESLCACGGGRGSVTGNTIEL